MPSWRLTAACDGIYTQFTDPLARAVIVQYYQFLRLNDPIYQGNQSHSEAALLFPRRQVHQGEVRAVESFRKLGQALLDAHVLFDVWPDDQFPAERAAKYARVVTVADSPDTVVSSLPHSGSRFEAPYFVRVSGSRPAGSQSEIDLHFVNYNRVEPPLGADGKPSGGTGIKDEKPLAIAGVSADLVLPKGAALRSVRFLTPEQVEPRTLQAKVANGRVHFALPEFLVYGVARVEFQSRD